MLQPRIIYNNRTGTIIKTSPDYIEVRWDVRAPNLTSMFTIDTNHQLKETSYND